MFCDKCGKNNPDGMAFCEACGNPLGEVAEAATGEESKTGKIIASIVAIAVALAVLIFGVFNLVSCIQTGASEKPIKEYFKAINKDNYNDIVNEQMPKEFKDIAKDYKEAIKADLKADKKAWKREFGSNCKVSYSMIDYIDYTDDEVKDVEKDMETFLGDEIEIEDAREYLIKVKIKGSEKKEEFYDCVRVYKIDKKWYSDYALNSIYGYMY